VDFLSFGFVALFLFGLFAFAGGSFTLQAAGPFVGFIGLLLAAMYAGHRHTQYGTCGEIRLDDDGTCELETKRAVIHLHVNEIRSVAYSRSDEGASYTIHYHGGHLPVTNGMTGFPDFLARLKTLNPAVDLTSFPPDRWPGLGTPATQERGTSVGRSIRGALFPVGVVAALIWLAIETLTTAK